MPSAVSAPVISRRPLENPEYSEIILDAPAIAAAAGPGQFVHVRVPEAAGAILRRPFSIAGAADGRLTLLVRNAGKVSGLLSLAREGDAVDVLGPLGNGYRLDGPAAGHALLVAGGYGVAPLLHLARHIRSSRPAMKVSLLTGARSTEHLVWRDRVDSEKWLASAVATDDGSAGTKGTVVDLAAAVVGAGGDFAIFACGPMRMLAALARRFPGIPAQVAVENQMGCGIGACQGCVLPATGGDRGAKYVRICKDGPVFAAGDIDWDSLESFNGPGLIDGRRTGA